MSHDLKNMHGPQNFEIVRIYNTGLNKTINNKKNKLNFLHFQFCLLRRRSLIKYVDVIVLFAAAPINYFGIKYQQSYKLRTKFDATEKADSDGTDVAGVERNRFAKFFSCGN